MGFELLPAILGPVLGGVISLALWLNRKNSEHIEKGFERVGGDIQRVERMVGDMRVDVAKNYVTNEELVEHIKGEEAWHQSMNDQMSGVRADIRDVRNSLDKLRYDK